MVQNVLTLAHIKGLNIIQASGITTSVDFQVGVDMAFDALMDLEENSDLAEHLKVCQVGPPIPQP